MTEPGHHLRDWRKFRKLTQVQLGAAIGKDRSYLSKIECGKEDYLQYIVERIAIVLDCSVGDLIDRDPNDMRNYFSVAEECKKFNFDNLKPVLMPEKRGSKKSARKTPGKK